MPKEKINHVNLDDATWTDQDGTCPRNNNVLGGAFRDPSVEVYWMKYPDGQAGHVQVGIEADHTHLAAAASGEYNCRPQGRGLVLTGVLTREQVNTMIRVLRRARDQAYGKDE